MNSPNYKQIYEDILNKKYPHKKEMCESLLAKKKLNCFDVLKINNLIFNDNSKEVLRINQKYRSYDEETIKDVLRYQIKNNLNNTQLATRFTLSRNTISKWKKKFRDIV